MGCWDSLAAAAQAAGAAGADLIDRLRQSVGYGADARQAAVSMAVVALAAKMARADGVVTMSEAASFWRRFAVPAKAAPAIRRLFDLAQQDVAGFETYADRLARLFGDDAPVREDVLDILFAIAGADGHVHAAELAYLDRVAAIFELDPVAWDRLKARHLAPGGDPWAVLGLPRSASPAEIRARWRVLVVEHHPDRCLARGMPPEFARVANDRLAAINAAYDALSRRAA